VLGAPRRNAKLQLGKVICEEGVCDSRGQFISVLVDSLLEITLVDGQGKRQSDYSLFVTKQSGKSVCLAMKLLICI